MRKIDMTTGNKIRTSAETLETKKNSGFVLLLFWTAIIFRDTTLKFIWSLEGISRIVNVSVLALLIGYAVIVIANSGYYSRKMWRYYFLPGVLISGGMFINVSLNSLSNFKLISFFGLTIPWLTYLIIPSLIKKKALDTKALWRYYYYFMLGANILGILEYFLVFYGAQELRTINTPNGVFLAGYFSLFWGLADGAVHYRYYSCFGEPGSLAMLLLPAIAYAFFNRRYLGLPVFLIAFYLTNSLGGIVSLLMLIAVISFVLFNRNKKYLFLTLLLFFAVTTLLWASFGSTLTQQFEEKGDSRLARTESLTKTWANLPALVMGAPFGIVLFEDSESFIVENEKYTGTNFIPGVYLQYGGIISFLGYLVCLFVSVLTSLRSIKKDDLSVEGKVVFTSILVLLPFIFQRTTIWESSLFAFLFAPSVLKEIEVPFSGGKDRRKAIGV